tara:strand:+ start:88 stop:1071 length:984 start_codon:yes stop_codon:yes gene_type:complete
MQKLQKNQVFNFDKYLTFQNDIDPKQRAWIEVMGKAIEINVRQLRSKLSKSCQFMAVVKADGYGHDAKVVSKYAIAGGASQLAVATLEEGIELRSFGVRVPILILGNIYTKKELIQSFKNNLMPTISSLKVCLICDDIGKHFDSKFSLHLKVDTGMSRLGFECNKFPQQFEKIKSFENISIEGIYSHLSSADETNELNLNSFTQIQRQKFKEVLKQIKVDKNQNIKIHLANSAGMLLDKDFHFHMVRVGLAMYGYSPLAKIDENLSLKPALFLKVKVAFIRIIDKGVSVSYGRKFVSSRKTKLAVLSIGYADGVPKESFRDDKRYTQ